MRYVQERFPNMAKNIQTFANLHQSLEAHKKDKVSFTPEQENRYKTIIKKYRQLKAQHEQYPYPYSIYKANLAQHAHKMSQLPRLMQYVQQRFPSMAKNINILSRSHQLEQDRSIDR
jgi:hypothetical protein